jgi:hypothetical protein
MKPNYWSCQECPEWDDVNGCWRNCKSVCCEGRLDEEGNYIDDEEGEKT